MASSTADAAPKLAPDVAEIAAASLETVEAMRLAAELPSSDEDVAAEATAEAMKKEPQSESEIIRNLEQRLVKMEYDHRALQNKLNARNAHIENLQNQVASLEARPITEQKTEDDDTKPAEIVPPPGVTEFMEIKEPVELQSPPDDPWEEAAASLPATRAPQPAAQPPTTVLEQKFLKLLEVVEEQNADIANMRADMQWYHSEWQNTANVSQASPPGPTTAASMTPTTIPTTRALAPIDRKVIDKPYKYTGDIKVYPMAVEIEGLPVYLRRALAPVPRRH